MSKHQKKSFSNQYLELLTFLSLGVLTTGLCLLLFFCPFSVLHLSYFSSSRATLTHCGAYRAARTHGKHDYIWPSVVIIPMWNTHPRVDMFWFVDSTTSWSRGLIRIRMWTEHAPCPDLWVQVFGTNQNPFHCEHLTSFQMASHMFWIYNAGDKGLIFMSLNELMVKCTNSHNIEDDHDARVTTSAPTLSRSTQEHMGHSVNHSQLTGPTRHELRGHVFTSTLIRPRYQSMFQRNKHLPVSGLWCQKNCRTSFSVRTTRIQIRPSVRVSHSFSLKIRTRLWGIQSWWCWPFTFMNYLQYSG